MNQITIIGNIAEPKLQFTNGGTAKLEVGLATTYTNQKDEKQTTWHNIVAWGQFAENLAGDIKKGDRLIVIGRIVEDKYVNKDGEEKTYRFVLATDAGLSCKFTSWSNES